MKQIRDTWCCGNVDGEIALYLSLTDTEPHLQGCRRQRKEYNERRHTSSANSWHENNLLSVRSNSNSWHPPYYTSTPPVFFSCYFFFCAFAFRLQPPSFSTAFARGRAQEWGKGTLLHRAHCKQVSSYTLLKLPASRIISVSAAQPLLIVLIRHFSESAGQTQWPTPLQSCY